LYFLEYKKALKVLFFPDVKWHKKCTYYLYIAILSDKEQNMRISKSQKKKYFFIFRGMQTVSCLLVFLFLGMFISAANAQSLFQFGMNAQGGFPKGRFQDNIGHAIGGLNLEFTYSLRRTPLAVGISFGFFEYGSETISEFFQATNADFELDVRTTNMIILGHLLFRLQPKKGRIRPYLDALIGINYLTTDTKIVGPDSGLYDYDISRNNLNDTVLSYGGDLGLMLMVVEKPLKLKEQSTKNRKWAILIDSRVRYLKGGEAEYLIKGSISRVNNELVYNIKKSPTDLLGIQLGITLNF
jgi:hypothetical protein